LNSIAEHYNIIAKFGTFFMIHPVYWRRQWFQNVVD